MNGGHRGSLDVEAFIGRQGELSTDGLFIVADDNGLTTALPKHAHALVGGHTPRDREGNGRTGLGRRRNVAAVDQRGGEGTKRFRGHHPRHPLGMPQRNQIFKTTINASQTVGVSSRADHHFGDRTQLLMDLIGDGFVPVDPKRVRPDWRIDEAGQRDPAPLLDRQPHQEPPVGWALESDDLCTVSLHEHIHRQRHRRQGEGDTTHSRHRGIRSTSRAVVPCGRHHHRVCAVGESLGDSDGCKAILV